MLKGELDKSYLDYEGDIPDEYTIPDDRIPPIHNQHIGTTDYRCMSYATTGCTRIIYKVYSGEDVDFSEAYNYARYRRESNRNGKGMFVSDLIPGLVNGGCIPQDAMPDIKEAAKGYDYVLAHPELDAIAKPYAKMFKGYINLKDKRKKTTFENIKKALLKYNLPLYGEYVGHAIIFVGYKGDKIKYRDCDGSNWLKLLNYKDVKESFAFIMADKNKEIKLPFVDVPDNHWAKNTIEKAYNIGLAKGNNENKLEPDKFCTKAEAFQIAINLYEILNK